MWKKFFKYLGIVLIGIVLIFGTLWGIFYKEAYIVAAVVDEDPKQVNYWIYEKNVNPNSLFFGFNLISVYLSNARDNSKPEFVTYLLKKGVNPNLDAYGKPTSLDLAILLKRSDIVEILLKYGARVDIIFKEQMTPLGAALRLKDCEIVKLLVKHKASLVGDKSETSLKEELEDCYK